MAKLSQDGRTPVMFMYKTASYANVRMQISAG